MNASPSADAFAERFNARDLEGLAALLAEDATAEVLDSGFPVERGRDVIAKTSLPHILGEIDPPLSARVWAATDEEPLVLLVTADDVLDTVVRVIGSEASPPNASITRLEYLVGWHRPADLAGIAAAAGLTFTAPEA